MGEGGLPQFPRVRAVVHLFLSFSSFLLSLQAQKTKMGTVAGIPGNFP